jgi:hypothetical protein
MTDMIKIVLLVALIAAIVIFGPLITIWSLNTLFPMLAIPTNVATWFATLWIFGFFAMKGKK